jgi:hypothetical protein
VVARGAWLGVVVLTLGLAIPGFVVAFDQPELLHQPELLGFVERLGMPNQVVMAAGLLVPMAAVSAIAIFLFWRRSDDWMAMVFSLQLITSSPSRLAPYRPWSMPTQPYGRRSNSSGCWRSSSSS